MESALSPREIQTRIRSGESVDDVARVAGVERDRVERFAAPVIAEREHVAGLAMTSSARRRGETSSHRTLRGVLNERLLNRGVDIDTVRWDSYRLDDGRWAVTADYSSDTPRQAVFYFDVPGRYSVAGNDEGRWVLGDTTSSRSGRPPSEAGEPEDDTEPTIDLSDELALVRAIQDIPVAGSPKSAEVEITEVTIAEVFQLNRTSEVPKDAAEQDDAEDLETELAEVQAELDRLEAEEQQSVSGLDVLSDIFEDQDPYEEQVPAAVADPQAAEPTVEVKREPIDGPPEVEEPEDEAWVEDSAPSDASAVPELSLPLQPDAWEPAIVVDYPIEPSEDVGELDGYEVPEGSDDPGRPEAAVAREDRLDEAASLVAEPEATPAQPEETGTPEGEPARPGGEPTGHGSAPPAAVTQDPVDEPLPLDIPDQPTRPPAPKPARRKRASVPSWDEIVFGGPKD